MEVVIASDDGPDLFADIRYQDSYWAEVRYDKNKNAFILTISPDMNNIKSDDGYYVFDLDEVRAALERAKRRLIEVGYGEAEKQVE